jgi:hypothetical protein
MQTLQLGTESTAPGTAQVVAKGASVGATPQASAQSPRRAESVQAATAAKLAVPAGVMSMQDWMQGVGW